jgi:hypothetical protein
MDNIEYFDLPAPPALPPKGSSPYWETCNPRFESASVVYTVTCYTCRILTHTCILLKLVTSGLSVSM